MTTDIKNRLSDLGKQFKEKLTAKQAAEEAKAASPADDAVREKQMTAEKAGLPTEAAAADAETVEDREIAETTAAMDAAFAAEEESAEKEDLPPTEADAADSSRITDEKLAAVLQAYGWHVAPGEETDAAASTDAAVLQEPALTLPELEELAEEIFCALEVFSQEILKGYEEAPVSGKAAEADQPTPVSDATAVYPVIGGSQEEKTPAEEPEGTAEEPPREEPLPEEPPLEERPPEAPEPEVLEGQPVDSQKLFSAMNQDILKEVFSEEELNTLEGDDTHVFKKGELEDFSGKQKEAEEEKPARADSDRRRARRADSKPEAEKPAAEKPAKKPAPAAAAEPEYTPRDFRPIRRKRSYRTGLRGGLMYFGFVICVSVILASVGWLAADDVLSLNKDYVEAEVYVGEDLDMNQVSAELYNKGLIKYRQLFRLFAKLMKADTKIEPGVYTLSSKLDYNAMVHAMHQSDASVEERATVKVTIPEGKTLKQTFQLLAEHGVCPYETLLECSANYEFKYDFLEELPYGSETRLEGYLFPDTYEFYAPSDPEDAIEKFLDNFNSKVSMEMRTEAAEMGYSLHEIITVASLVEMEAGKDTERAAISSVIYNRLSSSYYPYLQIDATIQYALEERKESLTNADLEIDSPYNTYKYTGLPPGPIANPGLASIRAALAPESTGYYFYALNKSGSHNFFATQSQFEYFVNSSEFGG